MRFFGTYYHNLDAKGRLVVPARFREELKELKTLYLLQGFEGCISVYPPEAYEKELTFLDAQNYKDEKSRAYVRSIYASIEELEVDNAGRLSLSVKLLKKYNLATNVVVLGVGDHLEIWEQKAYEDFEAKTLPNLSDLASHLRENQGE